MKVLTLINPDGTGGGYFQDKPNKKTTNKYSGKNRTTIQKTRQISDKTQTSRKT